MPRIEWTYKDEEYLREAEGKIRKMERLGQDRQFEYQNMYYSWVRTKKRLIQKKSDFLQEERKRKMNFVQERQRREERSKPRDLQKELLEVLKKRREEEQKRRIEQRKRQLEIQKEVQKALEAQRKEMRKRIIASGFGKFFKKTRPVLTRYITKLLKAPKMKDLDEAIEHAVKSAYGITITSNIQKDLLKRKEYWAEMAFYMIMPEARVLGKRNLFASAGMEKTAIFRWLSNRYSLSKNKRKYKELYTKFESRIRPTAKRAAIWFIARLQELVPKLQSYAEKAFKEDVILRSSLGEGEERVIMTALMATANKVAPDVDVSHEGIKFTPKGSK